MSVFIDTKPIVIDANTKSISAVWPVGPYLSGTVQLQSENGNAWTSGVVEIKRSNDGARFHSFASAVTLSADGMTAEMDLSGVAFVAAVVTTANGAALTLHAFGCFKANEQ